MTTTEHARRLVPVTLRCPNDVTHDVLGETTPAAGLVITPGTLAPDVGEGFTGTWVVTHVPSGKNVVRGRGFRHIEDARALAVRLARLHPDWSDLDGDTSTWEPAERTRLVDGVRTAVAEVDEVRAEIDREDR